MSVTRDIRSYADTAVAQGKQVIDQFIDQAVQAQAQLGAVGGAANDYVGKLSAAARMNVGEIADRATDAAQLLRTQAEKAVKLDALTAVSEPYRAQVKGYTSAATDKLTVRVDTLLSAARQDPRVGRFVTTTESLGAVLLVTVSQRVLQPVMSLTGVGGKSTASNDAASKPATSKPAARKPAVRKPAAPKAAAPGRKAAATKPATRPATTSPARKAAARKTTVRPSSDN